MTGTDPDFPEELQSFLSDSVPTVDAAELMVFIARGPDRPWTAVDLVREIRPTEMGEPAVRSYLELFAERGVMRRAARDGYRYQPRSEELRAIVRALIKAYNERPVTLIRMIHDFKEAKIRSFADAFRIRKG